MLSNCALSTRKGPCSQRTSRNKARRPEKDTRRREGFSGITQLCTTSIQKGLGPDVFSNLHVFISMFREKDLPHPLFIHTCCRNGKNIQAKLLIEKLVDNTKKVSNSLLTTVDPTAKQFNNSENHSKLFESVNY